MAAYLTVHSVVLILRGYIKSWNENGLKAAALNPFQS